MNSPMAEGVWSASSAAAAAAVAAAVAAASCAAFAAASALAVSVAAAVAAAVAAFFTTRLTVFFTASLTGSALRMRPLASTLRPGMECRRADSIGPAEERSRRRGVRCRWDGVCAGSVRSVLNRRCVSAVMRQRAAVRCAGSGGVRLDQQTRSARRCLRLLSRTRSRLLTPLLSSLRSDRPPPCRPPCHTCGVGGGRGCRATRPPSASRPAAENG